MAIVDCPEWLEAEGYIELRKLAATRDEKGMMVDSMLSAAKMMAHGIEWHDGWCLAPGDIAASRTAPERWRGAAPLTTTRYLALASTTASPSALPLP